MIMEKERAVRLNTTVNALLITVLRAPDRLLYQHFSTYLILYILGFLLRNIVIGFCRPDTRKRTFVTRNLVSVHCNKLALNTEQFFFFFFFFFLIIMKKKYFKNLKTVSYKS